MRPEPPTAQTDRRNRLFGLEQVPAARRHCVVRYLGVPAARIHQGWAEASALRRWWSDPGSTIESCRVDMDTGGVISARTVDLQGRRTLDRMIVLDHRAGTELMFAFMDDPAHDPMSRGRYMAHILLTETRWRETLFTSVFHYWEASALAQDRDLGVLEAWDRRFARLFAWAASGCRT